MRPVRRPAEDTDIGHMLPYRRASFGLDAMELRGSGSPDFAAILGLKDYPEATTPGMLDGLLRLPFEMVVTESYAPSERTTAKERIDLALRRLRSVDEEAARSEEHTSELQSLMRISYAVFCLKKKKKQAKNHNEHTRNQH